MSRGTSLLHLNLLHCSDHTILKLLDTLSDKCILALALQVEIYHGNFLSFPTVLLEELAFLLRINLLSFGLLLHDDPRTCGHIVIGIVVLIWVNHLVRVVCVVD